MWIVGITGSFAMGKSTVMKLCKVAFRGARFRDADAVVHQLLAAGGAAVEEVLAAFPNVRAEDGGVDRKALGAEVFGNEEKLNQLEAIVLPKVRAANLAWLKQCAREGAGLVFFEAPLMFETGADGLCDEVWVASAPKAIQQQRALKRKGMTPQKLQAILARQWPDAEKRRAADAVIPTGLGKAHTMRMIKALLDAKE